jgi:hypothetical protein
MYDVIVAYQKEGGLNKLIKDVKAARRKGWKCQGGICVVMNYDNYKMYYQAMVKEK